MPNRFPTEMLFLSFGCLFLALAVYFSAMTKRRRGHLIIAVILFLMALLWFLGSMDIETHRRRAPRVVSSSQVSSAIGIQVLFEIAKPGGRSDFIEPFVNFESR